MNNEELIPIIKRYHEQGMPPIKAILTAIGYNEGWYSALKILPHYDETMIFWIIGARRIGKTDLYLRVSCLLWIVFQLRTMWIRNKMVELQDPAFMNDFLNDAIDKEWCPADWTTVSDGVHVPDSDDPVIKFQSISTFSNRRGGAHPDVEMMLFDEFCPEDRKFPKMCAVGLVSLTKTVFSGKTTARLFCLSNFVSAGNPYFVKMRIYPSKGKDITAYPEKGMLIERCTGYRCAIDDNNPWNRVYRSAGIGNYASEEEDQLNNLISPIPKGCRPDPYVFLNDGLIYRGWNKNGMHYFSEYKGSLKDTAIFTPNLKECSDTVNLIHLFMRRNIEEEMQMGRIRFKDPNTMFAILSMVFETV